MSQSLLTGSQTVGPFFAPCLLREGMLRQVLATAQTPGEPIRVEGRVLDGDGLPISDALVEIWQADASGHYTHSAGSGLEKAGFNGFGRSDTAGNGYWFETIKPGAVPFEGDRFQAPHLCVTIFARGLLNHLVTRLYFEDEAANVSDPLLLRVPEERRATLLARRESREGKTVYHLDIILQGPSETAFFNL